MIEVADHADPHGVRRPDRERGAADAVQAALRRAHHLVRTQVGALAEQPDVEIAEDGRKPVRIVDDRRAAIGPSHLQPVRVGRHFERPLEESVCMAPREAAAHGVALGAEHLDVVRAGQKSTQPDPAVPVCVRTEHRERIAVARRADQLDVEVCKHLSTVDAGAELKRRGHQVTTLARLRCRCASMPASRCAITASGKSAACVTSVCWAGSAS